MRNSLSNPMLCKAGSAEFGRSIAIGAATQHAIAKENGFLYPRLMREWTGSLSCETSLSRVEEASLMSVKSFIALAGRRFMSALAHETVSRTSNTGLFRRADGVAGIGESCDATRECMYAAVFAIPTTRLSCWMAGTRFSVTQRISRTPCVMWLSWTSPDVSQRGRGSGE